MKKLFFFFIFQLFLLNSYSQNTSNAYPDQGIKAFSDLFVDHFNIKKFNIKEDKISLKIQFTVDADGNFRDVLLKLDPYQMIDEVKRVFSKLPKWNPAYKDGIPVSSKFTIPVTIFIHDKVTVPNLIIDANYISSLNAYDVDNEWFSFSCNCKLEAVDTSNIIMEGIYDYHSFDNSLFYRVELFKSSIYNGNDFLSFVKEDIKTKGGTFQIIELNGEEVYELEKNIIENHSKYIHKTYLFKSEKFITSITIVLPETEGIEMIFDHIKHSFKVKNN